MKHRVDHLALLRLDHVVVARVHRQRPELLLGVVRRHVLRVAADEPRTAADARSVRKVIGRARG